jgi:hypothetical protein
MGMTPALHSNAGGKYQAAVRSESLESVMKNF